MRVPPGSGPGADGNDSWTFYGYDAAGNLAGTQDPRGNTINYGYDNRNRRTSMTVNGLNQTTTWEYDTMNNLTRETRPDQSYSRMEYDSMNRVIDTYGFAGEHTHYDRDLAGNVHQLVDAKGAGYVFYYDAMNRKASAWYPLDATGATRYEAWYRDEVGNVYRHDNPSGNVQILQYDNRNRMYHSYWWGNVGPDVTTQYDSASRLTSVTTNGGETTVTFGYDDANRKISEEQTLSGYPTRRIEFWLDNDGNRTGLHVPGTYLIRYDFNQRNQLAHIYGGGWEPWFNYTYDAGGNVTQIQDQMWGVIDSMNCPSWQYDPLNRPVEWEQRGGVDNPFARSWQQYDPLGRMTATWRDEQSGKGDWFRYNASNQIVMARYNADQAWTEGPLNWDRYVDYAYTDGFLNRYALNNNGDVRYYSAAGTNQYTGIWGSSLAYDGNFNLTFRDGIGFSFDAQNRLTSATGPNGNMQCTYDGLGRCVRRTVGGVTRLFTYDGWKPTVEWDGAGNWLAWNVYGSGPDEILWRAEANVGHLRYHLDVHGNVAFILDGGGNGLEKYTYDAFGRPTITDWWGNPHYDAHGQYASWYGNRFMFQGREWIPELGIYDFRNRMYQPDLGRFLQMDPLGFDAGDMNLFRYCGDDPIDCSDPSGLEQIVDYDGRVIVDSTAIEDSPNPFEDDARWMLWHAVAPLDDYFNNSSPFGNEEFRLDNSLGASQPSTPTLSTAELPQLQTRLVPIFDARTERNIATLLPHVQRLAREHMYQVRKIGLDMRIIDGSRTFAQQDALFARGRTEPGPRVTNARGGESNHNFATAYDVGFFNGPNYIEDGPEYDIAGRIGMEVGLEWGGTWTSPVDRPHFQYPGGH